MNEEWSEIAANGVIHQASMAAAEAQFAFGRMSAPSVLYRPALFADGTAWCAMLGDNLQEGVSGFGDTPIAAMEAFDKAFLTEKTPTAIRLSKQA